MLKLRLLFLLIYPFLALKALAQSLQQPTLKNYESGQKLYQTHRLALSFEKGIFTTVPVDYTNPQSEKFEIYSWFAADYNPLLPTIVYFTGGPGQGSHWGQSALESKSYNLLFMDQRGISLSKPATLKAYLNPHFYKSEWTANDLEVLRQKLGISKLSIYAISYGTIPATIYASKYSATTTALVLEGTAFSAKHLATFDEKKKLVHQAIQMQTPQVQEKIYSLQKELTLKSMWFFQWARDTLLLNEGFTALSEQLSLLGDSQEYAKFLELLKTGYTPHVNDLSNDLYGINEIPYYMISCQELGLSLATTMTDLEFNKDVIVETRNKNNNLICESLKAKSELLYEASQFPVTIPITYFQGENDPATEVTGAILHYQKVAQGLKQMFILKNGGHNPNLQKLAFDLPAQREILERALRGELVTVDLIIQANLADQALQWEVINK